MYLDGNRFYSLNEYCKKKFGMPLYRLSLDAGMGCPNRDGTCSVGGCIFCSEGGSGDFAQRIRLKECDDGTVCIEDLDQAMRAAKERVSAKNQSERYIAYFQAYTNTYAQPKVLKALYETVAQREDVAVIAIATRPDCLEEPVLKVLEEVNQIKPVWVELGLQTIHESSLKKINSHITLDQYTRAVDALSERGIEVITHLILGLPWECREEMLESVRFVGRTKSRGIKLHLLHYLKNTPLGKMYEETPDAYPIMTLEDYAELISACIAVLPPDMVIHRMTGDGPKELLLAPLWTGNKKQVLNTIRKELAARQIVQGIQFV